jgi:hypothetical protein
MRSAGKTAWRSTVVPYRRDMSARKRPTPEDAATARRVVLDGLARDAEIFQLAGELAPLHPRGDTFPGETGTSLRSRALARNPRAFPSVIDMPAARVPALRFLCYWSWVQTFVLLYIWLSWTAARLFWVVAV